MCDSFRPGWAAREGEKLLAGTEVVANQAAEGRGRGEGSGLLHTAKGHAQVLGLDDDADALRFQVVVEPAGYLAREALLHLKPAGEQIHHSAEL